MFGMAQINGTQLPASAASNLQVLIDICSLEKISMLSTLSKSHLHRTPCNSPLSNQHQHNFSILGLPYLLRLATTCTGFFDSDCNHLTCFSTSAVNAMPSTSQLVHSLVRRASGESESSSLLPLWIILGVGVALAIGWFALSSCLGDNAREALGERIRGLFSRNSGGGAGAYGNGGSGGSRTAYGRMRDDENEAFDINAAEHDLYDDLDLHQQPYDQHSAYPPSGSAGGVSKYDDGDDDLYDRRP